MRNFPIKLGGKEYWISRSVAVCGFIFTTVENKLCVLAVKRGKDCPDEVGKWCCPCGYLDYNETLKAACSREIIEESGLYVEEASLKQWRIDDKPNGKQNVTVSYYDYNKYYTEQVFIYNERSQEVDEIKWINVIDINQYEWAFDHEILIPILVPIIRNEYVIEDKQNSGRTMPYFMELMEEPF